MIPITGSELVRTWDTQYCTASVSRVQRHGAASVNLSRYDTYPVLPISTGLNHLKSNPNDLLSDYDLT